jgi:hypothetical protein
LWSRRYNGSFNGFEVAFGLRIDNVGNIYVAGLSPANDTTMEIAIVKYDNSGTLLWANRYLASTDIAISDFELDNSQNIYVAGTQFRLSTSSYDAFILKCNSSGAQQWTSYSDGGLEDFGTKIVVASTGNIYAALSTEVSNSGTNIKILKYNSLGSLQWTRGYSGSMYINDDAAAIDIDDFENVYVGGTTNDPDNPDIVLFKYNVSGSLQFTKIFNNNYDHCVDLSVDAENNVVVIGNINYAGPPYNSFVTYKYSGSGVLLWTNVINSGYGDSVDDLDTDSQNNVYIAGSTTADQLKTFTIKYNSSGVLQWQRDHAFNSTSSNSPENLFIGAGGNIYVIMNTIDLSTQYGYISTLRYRETSPPVTLYLTSFLEGFYFPGTNYLVSDTVQIVLRNATSPYSVVDSAKAVLDNSGYAPFIFQNAANSTQYYIVFKHRNSIQTWSKLPQAFSSGVLYYDFGNDKTKAYGDNLKQIDSSPLRFGIYGGDVNQDGVIDASDGSYIENDAFNYLSGYLVTDVNGDRFVDGSDFSIADNNAFNYIIERRP